MARMPPVFTSMTMPAPPCFAPNLSTMDSMPFSRQDCTLTSSVSIRLSPFSAS